MYYDSTLPTRAKATAYIQNGITCIRDRFSEVTEKATNIKLFFKNLVHKDYHPQLNNCICKAQKQMNNTRKLITSGQKSVSLN